MNHHTPTGDDLVLLDLVADIHAMAVDGVLWAPEIVESDARLIVWHAIDVLRHVGRYTDPPTLTDDLAPTGHRTGNPTGNPTGNRTGHRTGTRPDTAPDTRPDSTGMTQDTPGSERPDRLPPGAWRTPR